MEEDLYLLRTALEEEGDLAVTGYASDGSAACTALLRERPDILVTDLLLPGLDGLSLLRRLRHEDRMPPTVVISSFVNEYMARALSVLGVRDYVPKPFTAAVLAQRIREAADPAAPPGTQDPEQFIHSALRALGIPAHLDGRRYVQRAVAMALQDRNYLHGITKSLYPELAKYFHTNSRCIERSIRSAVGLSWKHCSREERHAYFGSVFDDFEHPPSNARLIAALTEFIALSFEGRDVWKAR